MKFSFSRKNVFPPELMIYEFNDQIAAVRGTKLLGIILTDDLKWAGNENFKCKVRYSKMWTLRRMKVLDMDPFLILDIYMKEIRIIVELVVPAWHCGLNTENKA